MSGTQQKTSKWKQKTGPTNTTLLAKVEGTLATNVAATLRFLHPDTGAVISEVDFAKWILATELYKYESNVKKACAKIGNGDGKYGGAHYQGKDVKHTSSGDGEGDSCTIFYVLFPGNDIKLLALGSHNTMTKYNINQTFDGWTWGRMIYDIEKKHA